MFSLPFKIKDIKSGILIYLTGGYLNTLSITLKGNGQRLYSIKLNIINVL